MATIPPPGSESTATASAPSGSPSSAAGGSALAVPADGVLGTILQQLHVKADLKASPTPLIRPDATITEKPEPTERFYSMLAAVAYNAKPVKDADQGGAAGLPTGGAATGANPYAFDKQTILELVERIDQLVEDQLNEILHDEKFQALESVWRSVEDLVESTDFLAHDVMIDLLDLGKEEAHEDLELNLADIAGSEIFKKVYVNEYDQFGGSPYGAMIGLYSFDPKAEEDLTWLKGIAKVAAASHAPFVSAVAPTFFGPSSMLEVNQLRDIAGLFNSPVYRNWNKFRKTDEAAHVGLVMPRYMVRAPYHPETNPARGVHFKESVDGSHHEQYLWGNAAMLFARNLVRSFQTSGWCQHIRGVKSGGLVADLPTHTFNLRGEDELKAPVEVSMPDFREFELANAGFIPLVHKKGTSSAVFFSAQSIKLAETFDDPKDSETSQLVSNMSYTFSIARIAHYLKCIMRDNIGSTANDVYIYNQIDRWVSRYVTTLINPDDLTLRYYPFKAYSLDIKEVPGRIGWYHCNLSILPHVQFEGMDVDLRVDARLGAK
jgi:type VI secretion system protein ImpC